VTFFEGGRRLQDKASLLAGSCRHVRPLDPISPHLLIIDLAIFVFWRPPSTENRPIHPAIPPPGRCSDFRAWPLTPGGGFGHPAIQAHVKPAVS